MKQTEKRRFIAAGILTAILVLSALMGLAGVFSSATSSFSPFIIIHSLSFVALVFLSVVLLRQRAGLPLSIALGLNALLSLLSLCFSFTLIDLFIFLTLAALTANSFLGTLPEGKRKYLVFGLSLLANAIPAVSLIGFHRHIERTVLSSLSRSLSFDISVWGFYFSPFVYALLYATVANLLLRILNRFPEGKKHPATRIPWMVLLATTVATLIFSAVGFTVGDTAPAAPAVFMILMAAVAALSLVAFPLLTLLFTKETDE